MATKLTTTTTPTAEAAAAAAAAQQRQLAKSLSESGRVNANEELKGSNELGKSHKSFECA